ncbi:MAG: OsmC family protein [Planctomycetaceae bacterium]
MARIDVTHEDGDRYAIKMGPHTVLVDQPGSDGSAGVAPTPTDLWVMGLAGCVAFYAGRFLDRHGIDRKGLEVICDFEMATDRPARVASIDLRVCLPEGFPEDKRARLLAVVDHCTVHNSMTNPPAVAIALAAPSGVPA